MELGTRVTILKSGKVVPAVLVDVIPKGKAATAEQAGEYYGFPPTISAYLASPYPRYVFKYIGRAGFMIVPDIPEAEDLWQRILPVPL